MTGFSDFGSNPLSAVSIASFGDMFYAVDLEGTVIWRVPRASLPEEARGER